MHRNFLQGLYSVYDIGGLYAKHNREYNVFLHEPFLVLSLKRVVLEENRSIKTDLVTFLFLFICYVSYLTWPDPPAPGPTCMWTSVGVVRKLHCSLKGEL